MLVCQFLLNSNMLGCQEESYYTFSPTRSVSRHVRLSVCVHHRETPTSGGHVDLWLKIAFLILVWDDTIFKKKGGVQFVSQIVKMRGLGPHQKEIGTRPPPKK